MKVYHIPRTDGGIPLRMNKVIEPVTQTVVEQVSKPHRKSGEIREAGKMLAEGLISREVYIRIVNGFFP
jgi:hypothetical protein